MGVILLETATSCKEVKSHLPGLEVMANPSYTFQLAMKKNSIALQMQ